MKLVAPLALVTFALGCGAAPKRAAEAPVAPEPESATPVAVVAEPAGPQSAVAVAVDEETTEETASLPSTCTGLDPKLCLPDADFAKRLCAGVYPEVALTLFGKDQPWSRAYLTGDYEAWNASGGKATRARLAFDEEVIVLSRRQMRTGIVMTGAGATYDVLRWDGTCVSLEAGEMTMKRPPAPKAAPIPWRRLGETTRVALLAAPKVQASQKAVQKECTGSETSNSAKSSGASKCDRADAAFDK